MDTEGKNKKLRQWHRRLSSWFKNKISRLNETSPRRDSNRSAHEPPTSVTGKNVSRSAQDPPPESVRSHRSDPVPTAQKEVEESTKASSRPSSSQASSAVMFKDRLADPEFSEMIETVVKGRPASPKRPKRHPFNMDIRVLLPGESHGGFDQAQPRRAKLDTAADGSFVYLSVLRDLGIEGYFFDRGDLFGTLSENESVRPIGHVAIFWYEDADKAQPPTTRLTHFLILQDPTDKERGFDFLFDEKVVRLIWKSIRIETGSQASLDQSPEELEALFIALRSQIG